MKNSFITLVIFFFISHIISQTSVLADSSLITTTCKKTPYFDLCVSSLKSDPRSASADLVGLARIMVDKLSAKATANLKQIINLVKRTTDPRVQKPLKQCAEMYDAVLKADVPEAIEALTKGNYKFAEQGANDAAIEADSCEKGFLRSPITVLNKNMHDISVVAASIVRNLL